LIGEEGKEFHCKEPNSVIPPIAGIDQGFANQLASGRQAHTENLDFGNMEELDDAAASFNLKPLQTTQTGTWNYVSTRNNNFSNRSQKGKIVITDGAFKQEDIGQGNKALMTRQGWIAFASGAKKTITQVTFWTEPMKGAASHVVHIEPWDLGLGDDKWAELGVNYEQRALRSAKFYYRSDSESDWSEISSTEFTERNGNTVAVANIQNGGEFMVEDEVDAGAVAAIVVAALVSFREISEFSFLNLQRFEVADVHCRKKMEMSL
jgi:hypothetical protein